MTFWNSEKVEKWSIQGKTVKLGRQESSAKTKQKKNWRVQGQEKFSESFNVYRRSEKNKAGRVVCRQTICFRGEGGILGCLVFLTSLLILMGLNYLNLDLYVGTIVSRTPGKTDTNVPGCTWLHSCLQKKSRNEDEHKDDSGEIGRKYSWLCSLLPYQISQSQDPNGRPFRTSAFPGEQSPLALLKYKPRSLPQTRWL